MQKAKVKIRAFSMRSGRPRFGCIALISSILSCATLFSVSPAQAGGDHYVCQIERFTLGANVLPLRYRKNFQVEFWLNEAFFRAVVFDPLIEHEFGDEIPARLSPTDNEGLEFGWMLPNAPLTKAQLRGPLQAHAVFSKSDGAFRYDLVSAQMGYPIMGVGQCKKQ